MAKFAAAVAALLILQSGVPAAAPAVPMDYPGFVCKIIPILCPPR